MAQSLTIVEVLRWKARNRWMHPVLRIEHVHLTQLTPQGQWTNAMGIDTWQMSLAQLLS